MVTIQWFGFMAVIMGHKHCLCDNLHCKLLLAILSPEPFLLVCVKNEAPQSMAYIRSDSDHLGSQSISQSSRISLHSIYKLKQCFECYKMCEFTH